MVIKHSDHEQLGGKKALFHLAGPGNSPPWREARAGAKVETLEKACLTAQLVQAHLPRDRRTVLGPPTSISNGENPSRTVTGQSNLSNLSAEAAALS